LFLLCLRCKAESYEHWIIDAGSSGSRLCHYHVEKRTACKVKESTCQDLNASAGMADLPAEEQKALLDNALEGKKGHLALLGTGGFRRLNALEQKKQSEHLNHVFATLGFEKATVAIISGEEEAELAYEAVRSLLGREVAVLEAGGATVQFARESLYVSRPVGVNTMLAQINRGLAADHCYDPTIPGKRSFQECAMAITGLLSQAGLWTREERPATELVLLGQSSRGLFSLLGPEFDLATLKKEGELICRLDRSELKNRRVPERFQRRTCFLLSYATALIESTGYEKFISVEAAWRDQAAVDGKFFPNCKKLD